MLVTIVKLRSHERSFCFMPARVLFRGQLVSHRFELVHHHDTNHRAVTTSCSADILSRATSSCSVDKCHASQMYSIYVCILADISSEDLAAVQSRILDNKFSPSFGLLFFVNWKYFSNLIRYRHWFAAFDVNENPICFAFDKNLVIRFADEFIFARGPHAADVRDPCTDLDFFARVGWTQIFDFV